MTNEERLQKLTDGFKAMSKLTSDIPLTGDADLDREIMAEIAASMAHREEALAHAIQAVRLSERS